MTRVLGILCCAWALAGAARAQEGPRPRDVEIGMQIGWTGFGTDVVRANGSRISLQGGVRVSRRFELEADITCLGGTERAPSGTPAFTLCTGSLGGLANFRTDARLMPYLRVAVGQAQLDRGAEAGVFDIEERSAALEAGFGGRLYLGKPKRFAVRLDASWLRTGVFGRWSTHASVALGVTYRMGKSR